MTPLTAPTISLVIAAMCALLHIALAALVIQRRAATNVNFLDGGDTTLLKRMRAHGNFIETTPIVLLMLLMLELAGLPHAWLWAFGAALVLGRGLHAWGLLFGSGLFGRIAGTLLTLFVLGAQAVACVAWAWG